MTASLRRAGVVLAGAATLAVVSIAATTLLRDRPGASAPAAAPADPALTLADLETRVRANPGDGAGWVLLGRSYFAAGRLADAAGADARAARLLPGRADIWSALGEAQTLATHAVDATAHAAFVRALAIDPKDARARYFLAVAKDVAGDHRGAVADWIALLGDAPPSAAWAPSVRDLVLKVAARAHIDVAGRVPAETRAAPAASDIAAVDIAGAAIPGPTAEQMRDASALTPGQQDEMARGMVATLAGRLTQHPRDAGGWMRLMRAKMVLGDRAGAVKALTSARRVFAGDATTLAALSDAADTLDVPTG